MKKKLMSLALVLSMMMTNLIAVTVKADETGGLLIYEPFKSTRTDTNVSANRVEAYGGSKDVSRQKIENVSGVPGISSAIYTGKNNYINVDAAIGTVSYGDFTNDGPNAKLIAEFDGKINITNNLATDNNFYAYIVLGPSNVGYNTNQAMGIQLDKNGTLTKTQGGGGYYANDKGVEINKWQHYRLEIVLTDDTKAVNRYNLYVDGELIATQVIKNTTMTNLKFIAYDSKGYGILGASFGVSNLSVYKQNSSNAAFSVEPLVLQLRKSYENMNAKNYTEAAAGSEELAAFQAAYSAAEQKLTSVYSEVKTSATGVQAAIEKAAEDLKAADDAVVSYITPVYPDGGYQYNKDFNALEDGKYVGKYDEAFDINYAPNVTTRYNEGLQNVLFEGVEGIIVHQGEANTPGWTDSEGRSSWDFTKEGPDATLVIEYDIRFDNIEASAASDEKCLKLFIGDQDACKQFGTYPIAIYPCNYITLKDGEWYRFRHEIYATNASKAKKAKMSFIVNGEKVLDNVWFGTYPGNTTSSYNKFPNIDFMYVQATPVSESGITYSYDNVSVYKANVNAPMTVNDGALVAEIRKLEKYAKITNNAVVIEALEDAKTAYNDAERTQESVDFALATLKAATSELADSEKPYEIEGFKYADSNGNQVYEAMNGGKITGVYLTEIGEYSYDSDVYVAMYKGERLETVAPAELKCEDVAVGDTVVVPVDITLPTANIHEYEFKAFVWSDNIMPLAEAYSDKGYAADRQINVYIAGDSIAQTYSDEFYPQSGYGQTIDKYFDSNVVVNNHAIGGRSSKSFIAEGRLDEIMNEINPGDYLMVGFMHNDQKQAESLATDANSTYVEYLHEYIKAARAKGAIPILCLSATRGLFSGGSHIGYYGLSDLGAYPNAMIETANKYGVMCVNAQDDWAAMIESELASGEYNTTLTTSILEKYYLYFDAQSDRFDSEKLNEYSEGVKDTTHLQIYGSEVFAKFIATELKKFNSALSNHVVLDYVPQESLGN